jgi:hypothetical protein
MIDYVKAEMINSLAIKDLEEENEIYKNHKHEFSYQFFILQKTNT